MFKAKIAKQESTKLSRQETNRGDDLADSLGDMFNQCELRRAIRETKTILHRERIEFHTKC